jgi:SAM-dependent methyltransferase
VLGREPYRSVLDVGAGDGLLLSRTTSASSRRVGTDIADEALAKMRKRNIEAVRADFESPRLPFDDASFDVTMCLDVLEHVFAPETLLSEIVRVTTPGGRVILAVPNAFNLANRAAYALGRHLDVMDVAHRTGARFSEHIRFFSEPVLDAMLATEHLAVTERRYYFPDRLSDIRAASWAARVVTVPRLHERLPSLFALGFFVVCRTRIVTKKHEFKAT